MAGAMLDSGNINNNEWHKLRNLQYSGKKEKKLAFK